MRNRGELCGASNCDRDAYCKGYCTKHYQQIRLKGKIIKKDYVFINGLCKNIGCGNKSISKGYCRNHYMKEWNANKG